MEKNIGVEGQRERDRCGGDQVVFSVEEGRYRGIAREV
jgi:hypothetical protein